MPFPLFPLPMAVPASLCRAPLLRSMFTPSIVFLSCPPGFTHSSLRLSFRFTPLFASLLFSSLLFCSLLFSLFSPFAFSLSVSLPNSDSFLPLRAPYLYSTVRSTSLPSLPGCQLGLPELSALPACLPACLAACTSRFSLHSSMRASGHPSSLCRVVRTDTSVLHGTHERATTPPSPHRGSRRVTSRVTSSPLFVRRYLTLFELPLSSSITFRPLFLSLLLSLFSFASP